VDKVMIVLGADAHKSSHTIAAIEMATGQLLVPLPFGHPRADEMGDDVRVAR
jgi:hypothetical protein